MLLQIIAIIIGLTSLVGIYNFFTATRLRIGKPNHTPLVSILIPARNEEKNIENCLQSIFKQDYPNYEVIVCDDNSEDNTFSIVESYTSKYPNLSLIKGKKLPLGWTGKTWACHQLSRQAKGELFLFLDADVTLKSEALSSAVALMEKKKVSLLSCFPGQKMRSFGEWLIIPLIDWLLLSFVPLDLVYRTSGTKFSMAIGQFILIKKRIYTQAGGHEAVKDAVTEDVEMARKVKEMGDRIIVARSVGLVNCRMYGNFSESKKGLARSLYKGTHLKPLPFILSLLGLFLLFFLPIAMFFVNSGYLYLLIPLLLQRTLTSILARQNFIYNLLLLPVHYFFTFYVSINSLYLTLGNKIEWKGRQIDLKALKSWKETAQENFEKLKKNSLDKMKIPRLRIK